MARPRIFISSTYYDLKYIRDGIQAFVTSLGYEAILFEKGDVPFHHDRTLEDSCYQEVEGADMLILIIGGRFGGLSREDEQKLNQSPDEYMGRIRSITNREYEVARTTGIPAFIFVDQNVFSEYRTYVENRNNCSTIYAHVDNPKIYEMVGDILAQKRGNYVKPFSSLDDITIWLKDQWAGLFADFLKKKNASQQLKSLRNQISDLSAVVSTLKKYSEEIIKEVNTTSASKIIETENKRLNENRAKNILREDLIDYLINKYAIVIDGKDEDIVRKLRNSNNLELFLQMLGLKPDEIMDFLRSFDLRGRRDWVDLKQRYAKEEEERG
ncbi:DUF4062 domain-containing protein [Methylocystis sp.]|uniref:DUF4062 domain-containing protein n=1 Tax=Methylocystis sp. TaxID=1911079 RepID=UPI002735EFAC|nr:DUF4062 domain-containing protein [Methylocystis sp.]MDP3555673.1 DUF4062 domain-containing protein [Methylocystis sp.]